MPVFPSRLCPELLISSRDEPLLQLAQERSCWNDHHGDMSEAYHGGKLRCYVHIMDQGLCYRVNTLAAYIEANRLVSSSVLHQECLVKCILFILPSYNNVEFHPYLVLGSISQFF